MTIKFKHLLPCTRYFSLCVLAIWLSGCISLFGENEEVNNQAPLNLGNAELHTFNLAQELFSNMRVDRHHRYAVAGFVPVTNMRTEISEQSPLMLLGHQLEQGLMTEAVRRGFITQDFKATNAIIMGDDSDRALSRDLTHLSEQQKVDFYITGTITAQQNGAMVNARVINVRNKDVVAAATGFFPIDLFWESEQVMLRNGQLYRTEKR